jgi:hypothetical protein
MLNRRYPRHVLKAQGRAQLGERPVSEPSKKEQNKYDRLLDFLSQSAAGSDRLILDRATDGVVSSSSAAQLLETWFASKYKEGNQRAIDGAEGDNEGNEDGDEDGDSFAEDNSYWPGGDDTLYGVPIKDGDSNKGRYPGNYTGGYFGTDSSFKSPSKSPSKSSGKPAPKPASQRVRRELEGAHGPGGPGAYLRSLRNLASEGSKLDNRLSGAGAKQNQEISRCGSPVTVTEEAGGSRVETFPTGARVLKDGLGHVREIVSAGGVTVVFKYDDKGHLSAFIRTDAKGTIHSLAEADKHGVILRDSGGRVKAQGQSMQVDACGCISIARPDGQFWSLDLVHNVNIERRLLPNEHGDWFAMTALFSSDGFRMATRFRKVKPEDLSVNQGRENAAGTVANAITDAVKSVSYDDSADSGNYRFYGRDGSIIEFASDDELKQLRPTNVRPALSRKIEADHRGKRQAGTAWEALREYVFNYLSML